MKQQSWQTWLRANGHKLGMLTGQDTRALSAVAACWDLLASCDRDGEQGALDAVRVLLPAMQEKCRPLAKELIARSLDWTDRDPIWSKVQS